MTPKEAKRLVDLAFVTLNRACDGLPIARELIEKAHAASVEQEQGHRRMGRGLATKPYRNSVETTARFFVVRDYLQPATVRNALDAVSINGCALYAAALRVAMPTIPEGLAPDVLSVDYVEHIAQP